MTLVLVHQVALCPHEFVDVELLSSKIARVIRFEKPNILKYKETGVQIIDNLILGSPVAFHEARPMYHAGKEVVRCQYGKTQKHRHVYEGAHRHVLRKGKRQKLLEE